MASKRKTTTAVVAGVAAAALLLGGTFAWVSISQQAKNEAAGIVNVGGRLHDDFDGKNKDVYVENFTDPYNGGQPIYARVRLDEYMEVGKDAGGIDVDGDGTIDAVPVITGTSREDITSWKPHVPNSVCAICASGDTCLIHDHWTWTMGGQDTENNPDGTTVFMPTFNKDKDSLDADINGTYHGTDDTDKVYYDDYVVYTTDSTTGGAVNEAEKEAYDGKIYSVTGNAQYDNDPDMDKNTVENDHYILKEETHTAKETADAKVITMAEWLDPNGEYNSQAGDYWVYDTDGWAYWANPIMPGEATGLLLDGIEMTSNPGEKCYYAINVVGQFATVGDWEYFDGFNETDNANALAVLTAASGNVPTVTVTNVNGTTLVKRGDSVNFSATTAVGAVSAAADDEYEWVVLDEELKKSETSTITANADGTATLKVGDEELSPGLYVAARSTKHGGAVGLSAVAVQIYNVTITAEGGATQVDAGNTLKFSATVTDNSTGDAETSGVIWSVSGQSENTNTNITDDGVLTIDENEQGATVLTVTATSKNGGFVQTYTVTVADKYSVTVSAQDDATTVDAGFTLQFTAEAIKNGETDTAGVAWDVSGADGVTISEDGLLSVPTSVVNGTKLTVTAASKSDDTVSGTYTVTVSAVYALTINQSNLSIDPGQTIQYTATLSVNGIEEATNAVTWKVTDSNGNAVSNATMEEDGKLTVNATTYDSSNLKITAVHNSTNSTASTTATVNYTLTLSTTGTFGLDGLRVDVTESYYSTDDISAAISDNEGDTRYNYAVNEDDDGVYLMITHDATYYEYADHGTRTLTVTGPEGKTASLSFACNSHANTSYTVKANADTSIIDWTDIETVKSKLVLIELSEDGKLVDYKNVTLSVMTNTGDKVDVNSSGNYFSLIKGVHSCPYVTITYRTENAWGKQDFRIRYAATDAVKGMTLKFVAKGGNFNSPSTTVTYGQNSSDSSLGNTGLTYVFRIYDANGIPIFEPDNFTIWQGDINITGSQGGYGCTNGNDPNDPTFQDGDGGVYWIWVPASNSTKFTFWFSYVDDSGEVGTFEATIW